MEFAGTPPDIALGAGLLNLVTAPHEWIHRRVERVQLEGERRVRRHVSLDLTVPSWYRELVPQQGSLPVPVALLKKQVLIGFNLADASGRSIPMLTHEQNAHFACSALIAAFRLTFGTLPSPHSSNLLARIATQDSRDASRALIVLSALFRAQRLYGVPPRKRLDRERVENFFLFCSDLSRNFIAFTREDALGDPGRTILKFSFEEYPVSPVRIAVRSSFAIRPTEFDFWFPGVGFCRNYHAEVCLPPGLQVRSGSLRIYWITSPQSPDDEPLEAGSRADRASAERGVAADVAASQVAHFHYPEVTTGSIASRARIAVVPSSIGVFRTSVAAIFLAAVLLWSLVAASPQLATVEDASAAVTLLVAIPGAVLASLSRPGEHVIVSQRLLGIRAMAFVSGVLLFASAFVFLSSGVGDLSVRTVWAIFAIAVSVLAIISVLGLLAATYRR